MALSYIQQPLPSAPAPFDGATVKLNYKRLYRVVAWAKHSDPSSARWHHLVVRQSNSIREGLPVSWHWATHSDPSPARWHRLVARQSNSIGVSVEINVVSLSSASRDVRVSSVGTDRQRHGESSTACMLNLENSVNTVAPTNGLSQHTEGQVSNQARTEALHQCVTASVRCYPLAAEAAKSKSILSIEGQVWRYRAAHRDPPCALAPFGGATVILK